MTRSFQRPAAPSRDDLPTASEEQRLRTSFADLRATCEALAAAADAANAAASHAFSVAERDAARAEHRAVQRAQADASEALESVGTVVRSRAERLAPGLAGMAFGESAWRSGEWLGAGSRYLRVGTVLPHENMSTMDAVVDGEEIPALVPLLDVGNVALIAAEREGAYPAMLAALHGLLLRAIATAPAGRCELIVFDPKIRGVLSAFGGLRKSADIFPEPLTTASALLERLHRSRESALRVAELAGAHDAVDLGELRTITGTQPEPYRICLLLDYPYGADSRVHSELLRLAEAGPRRGVSLLIHHDPTVPVAVSDIPIDVSALLENAARLTWDQAGMQISALPGAVVDPDPAPPRELVELVSGQVATAAAKGAAPLVGFRDLLPPPETVWTADAIDGVIAPIGKSGLDIVSIELRGADPALPNVLVGGASGQGKSNLLLVLLHSLAAAYSPAELEMYLLDFKEGLEFDRLGPGPSRPHWLPHAKVLGLEGDRLFGLTVLRYIDEEFRRRAERFRAGNANSLAAFRRQHPDEAAPRILVVIDEFQVLVAESDDIGREAIAILETLARRGRAAGIHLVLASQTLSGIDTLASKERSIFGQFPWRVSLKTEASESEAVLGRGNTTAATLRYRGEVVLNSDYGSVEHNRRAVVAFADERQLDRLRAMLWNTWFERGATPTPPRVFYASRPADPAELPTAVSTVDGTGQAVLGLPVGVSSAPVTFEFSRDPGRALAVLGDGRDDALGVLTAAAWSLARQHLGASAEFILLDGVSDAASPQGAELDILADLLTRAGHSVRVHSVGEIGDALLRLGSDVDDRLGDPDSGRPSVDAHRSIYVVGAGLHRAPRLNQMTMAGKSPAASLQRIVRDGPLVDVFLAGWWSSLRIFNEHLGYDVAPLVAGAVFLRAPESDVQAVVGPYVRYQGRPHRGLFVDRGRGGEPIPLVPFRCPSPVEADNLVRHHAGN